eukprot:366445-Chlamydomonas_euryale.AAC.18
MTFRRFPSVTTCTTATASHPSPWNRSASLQQSDDGGASTRRGALPARGCMPQGALTVVVRRDSTRLHAGHWLRQHNQLAAQNQLSTQKPTLKLVGCEDVFRLERRAVAAPHGRRGRQWSDGVVEAARLDVPTRKGWHAAAMHPAYWVPAVRLLHASLGNTLAAELR